MQSVIVTYLLSSFSGELENTNISKTISLFQLEYNGACLTGRGYGWTYSPTTLQSQLIDPPSTSLLVLGIDGLPGVEPTISVGSVYMCS